MAGSILDIGSRREGGRHRLVLDGELDLTSADRLTSAVGEICSDGAKELVLDVTALSFIDSTGLRAILNSKALCEETLCDFAITPGEDQVNDQVRRLFEITDLIGRLPFRDVDEDLR
jgi:anti-sigma B factor antagonist